MDGSFDLCPKDDSLDIVATSYSPGVRRLLSKVGAMRPFGLGHQDLHELAGIRVNAKEVERVSQMVGEQVKAFHNGQAKTREAKLGCLFTQTSTDKEGRPIRDEQSTCFEGTLLVMLLIIAIAK